MKTLEFDLNWGAYSIQFIIHYSLFTLNLGFSSTSVATLPRGRDTIPAGVIWGPILPPTRMLRALQKLSGSCFSLGCFCGPNIPISPALFHQVTRSFPACPAVLDLSTDSISSDMAQGSNPWWGIGMGVNI